MKYTDLENELTKRYQPVIEYLIENRYNANKINSNLDLAWENIHELDAIIHLLSVYKRDFNTLKRIIEDLHLQKDKGQEK